MIRVWHFRKPENDVREMLWRLSRPTLGMALLSAVCLLVAMGLIRLAVPGAASFSFISGFASILSGGALIAMILAVIELLLAAKALALWNAGKGNRCQVCDWPMSPSLVLPDRCVNPGHGVANVR